MDAEKLVEGYRAVLKQIYSCEAYYERVRLYLSRTQPTPGERRFKQRWLTAANARALVTSIIRQGIFGPKRVELLEVSCDCIDALPSLLRLSHDIGHYGLPSAGHHQKVVLRKQKRWRAIDP